MLIIKISLIRKKLFQLLNIFEALICFKLQYASSSKMKKRKYAKFSSNIVVINQMYHHCKTSSINSLNISKYNGKI
jgi:hypothetical protein